MQTPKSKRENSHANPSRFTKRIGSTLYRVTLKFPEEELETLEAKILRMIKNELSNQRTSGIMNSLQTGRLPEGCSL